MQCSVIQHFKSRERECSRAVSTAERAHFLVIRRGLLSRPLRGFGDSSATRHAEKPAEIASARVSVATVSLDRYARVWAARKRQGLPPWRHRRTAQLWVACPLPPHFVARSTHAGKR
jgi:hypothetical protein